MPHSFPPGSWSAAVLRLSQNPFWDHQMSTLDSSKCAITQMRAKNFPAERFLKLLRHSLLWRFGLKSGGVTGSYSPPSSFRVRDFTTIKSFAAPDCKRH